MRHETERKEAMTLNEKFIEVMEEAWELIKPAGDWRGPIKAEIECRHWPVVSSACEFFTATALKPGVADRATGTMKVEADGYRAGPAGDH